MPIQIYPVYDEDGYETEFFIDSNTNDYFNAYTIGSDGIELVARIRNWHNNVAPFENLDTGILYESVEHLCYKAA